MITVATAQQRQNHGETEFLKPNSFPSDPYLKNREERDIVF